MPAIDRATPSDIAALMRIERTDGFERLVGRWTADQHEAEMAQPGTFYLAARTIEGKVAGFVILKGLDDLHGGVLLRRIAVANPGAGIGSALLRAALAHAFAEPSVHRVELHCYPENVRARRAYLRVGFIEEGLMRDLRRMADGTFRSMLLMAILRPEWDTRAG